MDYPGGRFQEFKEDGISWSSDRIESLSAPANLQLILISSLTFFALFWTLTPLYPNAVSNLFEVVGWSDLLKWTVFLFPLFVGFVLFNSLFRMIHGDEVPVDVESGPLSGFASKTNVDRRWLIWIFSGMLSALHAIVYFVIAIFGGKTYGLVNP